ncbi:MAG: hypothetical protein R2939_15135 [Kofleriaceae bacterium]
MLLGFGAAGACGGTDDDLPSVDVEALDFGLTDCGQTGAPRSFLVSNTDSSAFTFTATLAGGTDSPYTVSPAAATVLAGSQVLVTVTPRAIPAVSATTDNLYGDTLTVTTDRDGDAPHEIALTQTAHGAILSLSTETLDFPPFTIGITAPTLALTITNAGNAATDIEASFATQLFDLASTSSTVDAGGSLATTVTARPSVIGEDTSDALTLTATGPLCAPLPSAIATGSTIASGTAIAAAIAGTNGRDPRTLCATTAGGFVVCTGTNEFGMRGTGTLGFSGVNESSRANAVVTATGSLLDGIVEITGGRAGFCGRKADNSVWCWGNVGNVRRNSVDSGSNGQPFAALAVSGASAFDKFYGASCSVSATGDLSCAGTFGNNFGGIPAPTTYEATGVKDVSLRNGGAYAILSDDTVLSFGTNLQGERGAGVANNDPAALVDGVTGAAQIASGATQRLRQGRDKISACARLLDGTAQCWGSNRHGQIGDGNTGGATLPSQVLIAAATPLENVTDIDAGKAHYCAIADGSLRCWGRGSDGQLGRSTGQNNSFAELTDPAIDDAAGLALFGRGSCVVRTTGEITCFGNSPWSSGSSHFSVPVFDLPDVL